MAQLNDPNNLYSRLRISNPLNFNQPTEQELFNRQLQENAPLQKELETRLDSVYRLSPNSEADSNIVDSAAVFMDLFDMNHEQALGLARTTFSTGLTKESRERMGFGQALGQTALNTFNQFSAGTNMALYMIGGNDEHKTKALEKQGKIVSLWEDYGFLGNTVLSSIQPLGSSLRYMGTTALLRGGSALLARAIGVSHPILATATFFVGTGLSFLANISITGLSQAGSDFLEYSQMADKNGTKLDLESPEAKTLFWTSALAHGTIESIGSELLPGVRYLNKTIDSVARNAILKESWKQVLMRVALGIPVGIIGEGFEEFLAVYNTALTENSLKYLANKEGASFDYTSGREMATEGWKAFTDGAVSMIIPSILTGALGGGVYNTRTKAAARANFNKTEGSVSIDRRYIEDVPKPTAPKEGEIQKSTAEREKLDPVKLVDVGGSTPKLVALNATEREKLGEAAARNAEAVEAVIVEQEPLSVEDRQSLVNRAALATGGKLSGDRIVYETSEDLEMAKVLLDPVSIQGDTVTFRDEDGDLVSLELAVAEEGMDVTEADISYYEDPEAPHSLARMTQDKALEYQERKLIKEAIGNVVEHTGGRISNADLEANVDAVKMVAETLNIPTDELLGKGVAFRLVDMVRDAEGNEVNARGSIESNISIEGQKQYTINISKTADATTILHELGHTLRGLATDEQIRDFRLFYGKGKEAAFIGDINKAGDKFYVGERAFDTLEQAQKLVEANEEAFANDFVAYLRTGQAPTADLRNIFARMKAVLNRFLAEFGYRLDPAVRQAFDNLLRRESQGLPYTGTIPADAEGNVLFQESEVLFQILPDFYDPKKKLEIDGIVFDNDTGKGAVGNQYDANYYGFTATMAASDFLRIASPLTEYQKQDIKPKIEGVIALPFLEVEWDDNKKRWIVYGHEGRHRVSSIINEKGADFELPVNLLTYKWRGERLTPEMVKAPFVSQMGDYLINPRGTRYLRGEKVADGFTGEKTTIRYLRQKTEKPAEPVKNLDDYTPSPEVTEMIDWLRNEGVFFQLAPPVKSDEFKRIFGDSKVVTKSGEPILVYHGSPSLFKNFNAVQLSDSGYLGAGFYFSSLKGIAETYASRTNSGYIYNAYLVMKNPLMWNEEWNGKWDDITKNILDKHPDIKRGSDEYGTLLAMELREMGYDGVLDMKEDVVNEAVVFDDNQVLLNNVEKYNLNNTLFQQAPPIDSEAFKAWFGDSKVVDENGQPLVVYHGSRQWFEAFNDGTEKKHSKAPKGSIFATSSRKVAGSYYDYWGGTDPDVILEKYSPLHQNYSWGTYRKGGVYSLYMKIENPLIIDFEGKLWDEGDYDINEIAKRAKSEGYDGVIAKNIRDIGFNDIPRDEYGNYQDTIATDYIAFNSTQVKATNNQGAWDAGNPNILFQEAVEKINNGSLAVLHNISADKLVSADEIGGLPSPSLAITRPDIPFVQFGEITLIADPSVATKAMEEGRLYDRDVWSPTVPRAEWKINQKVIDNFDKKIMPIIYEETGKYFSGSDAFSRSDITRGPNLLIDAYKRTIEAQIAFLKDRGIDYELKFKKPKAPFTFPIEVIKGNLEYFRSTKFETENSDTVREYLRPKVSEYLEKSLAHRKENNPALYETMKNDLMDSYLRFGVLDKVFNFAKTYDKDALVFDEYGTKEGIHQTIKDHDIDFTSWIKDNINGAYTDPKIKIGSKKYEYTAENILKWMRSQSERASQDTMTYGSSKAASNAGRPFVNREQVRDFEGALITREAQGVIWEETIKPLTESIQHELPDYNNRYSTWESLDAIYEAIGNYITKYGSTGTVPLMRKELSAKSFTKVPTWLLEQAVLLARRLATLQQDYFEAKPDRVVSLNEFVAAVVPKTLATNHRAILTKHGIDISEYNDQDERSEIVEKIYSNRSGNILFQLSDEAKGQLLEERKKDVQDAVENHFWVSSRILEEYLDEEWAQKEMATREYLEQFPWMLEEARQFTTPEEYLQFIETMSEDAIEKGEQYKLTLEDADWYRKIFAYARIQSPQDLDKQFVDNFTKDKKSIAQLARAIKTYQDIGNRKVSRHTKLKENSRIVVWKWGTFKGVSPYVKNFTEKSSDEDFERAKKLIQENPRAYRKALRTVSEAEERVMAFKTHSSTSSYGYSREAYYDELDEDMLAALDEPLLLSEMTDREAAEYLRTTSNKQERFNAREKLATHMGVYAMELQADAEVKRLGEIKDSEIQKLQKQRERLASELKETGEQFKKARKELRSIESALEKERARSWELVEKLDEKTKKASNVNQLEKDLADRRARVKELRTQLTEKSREARRLNRQVTAYENREESRKTREKIERLMKVAYVAIKVSPSMDASYHPVFGWVQERLGLTSEYSKPDAPWKKKVDMLEDYLPRDVLDMLSAGIQIDQWPVEALQALVDGMRMLQRQARIEGAYRADQTRMRRDRIALEYDRQTYGYTPMETDQSIESVMGEIRDRLDNRKQNFYNGKEGKAAKVAHVFRQSFAHIWSFSTWLDGQKENGIMFKTFARAVWEYYQEEFRNVQRRLSAFDDIRKQMGYNQERLAKKVFSYTTPGGNEVALNLEQAITAYIYSLNEKGLKKLIHASGNGMSHAILADLYQVLIEEDRQFAQEMIDAAGGDAEYMRLAEVFYRVYNHDLSREQNYFRFRAAGVEMENDIDLAKGIRKERFSFVERGFGEDRTEAIYPLNLNGMKNLTRTIEEQEHLIHFGEWVRDANYLLGPKGSLGHEVRVTYGDTSLKTLQTFVKRIAGAQDTISDFEKMLNNLITQVSSSLISANLSSMMKQAASMSYVLMGDISLPHAVRCMCWWSPTPEIRNWVHAYEVMCELDPSMKERTFDIEVKRSRNLEYTTKASRALAKIRDTGIKYTTQLGDSLITVKMWWGAYLTGLDKFANMEEAGRMREAVFYASRFIAETQSSSNPMDLAEIQTSRHTWQRLISAFKRDAFKRWNLAFYKLPQAVRNKQWTKAGGIITSQLLGLLILAGIRGLFIKKDDDDDEKYRKFLMKNLVAQLFEESIPYAGEGIASGILGFGGGDLLELDDVSGRWLGEFFDGDKDWETFWKRSWELAITSLSTVGVPSLAVERTIKSVDEMNFWRMIGGYWYKLGEDE